MSYRHSRHLHKPRPARLSNALGRYAQRSAVLAAFGATPLLGAAPMANAQTQLQEAARSGSYAIPAGPLASVLTRYAVESGLMLSYSADDVAGRRSGGLQGSHDVTSAMTLILAGTGLAAHLQPNGGYLLRPMPSAPASVIPTRAVLAQIDVTATPEGESAMGPVPHAGARRTASATKTDTPLLEVPQSVSVVSRNDMDARGVLSVMDALRYVPGVAVDTYGVEPRGMEWSLMRGFDSASTSYLVDGLRMATSNWINFQTETYSLERIEVLRGPASVTYGQVEAGGTVHRINKRPSADAPREIEVQTGSYGRKQIAADVGGALNAEGSLLYRVVGLALDTDTQLRFGNGPRGSNERQFIAPSLTWRPSADTTLTMRAEHLRNETKGFSVFVVRNGQNTGLLRGDPDHLRYGHEQSQLAYDLQHRINDTWTFRQNARHATASVDNRFINQFGAISGSLFPRNIRLGKDALRQTSVDTHLAADLHTGRLAHTVLLGVDWTDARADYREYHAAPGTTPPLNLDAPVYGVPFPEPDLVRISSASSTRQLGVYLQDQVKLKDRWVITAGGRQDSVITRGNDRLAGTQSRQRDNAFSGRVGLTYLVAHGVTPYVSYAQSFMPQNLRTVTGEPYRPTKGRQWEVGVKVQPPGTATLFTAALFDLTKTNVETYDPLTASNSQTGKIRSRGLEVEARTRIGAGLNVYGAFTYNDVEVTESQDEDLGKTPIQVPRTIVSAGVDYALSGALTGFGVGAGVRYVGRRYDNPANTLSTPAFTLIDAAIRYDVGTWRVALNATNLFDKDYTASRAYGGHYPGARRMVMLSAKYRF